VWYRLIDRCPYCCVQNMARTAEYCRQLIAPALVTVPHTPRCSKMTFHHPHPPPAMTTAWTVRTATTCTEAAWNMMSLRILLEVTLRRRGLKGAKPCPPSSRGSLREGGYHCFHLRTAQDSYTRRRRFNQAWYQPEQHWRQTPLTTPPLMQYTSAHQLLPVREPGGHTLPYWSHRRTTRLLPHTRSRCSVWSVRCKTATSGSGSWKSAFD
jgi:hypothetical protein